MYQGIEDPNTINNDEYHVGDKAVDQEQQVVLLIIIAHACT